MVLKYLYQVCESLTGHVCEYTVIVFLLSMRICCHVYKVCCNWFLHVTSGSTFCHRFHVVCVKIFFDQFIYSKLCY